MQFGLSVTVEAVQFGHGLDIPLGHAHISLAKSDSDSRRLAVIMVLVASDHLKIQDSMSALEMSGQIQCRKANENERRTYRSRLLITYVTWKYGSQNTMRSRFNFLPSASPKTPLPYPSARTMSVLTTEVNERMSWSYVKASNAFKKYERRVTHAISE